MSIALAEAGVLAIEIGTDIASGKLADASTAARKLFDLATGLIPADKLRDFLTDYDRQAVDIATDVAEEVKLDT